MDAEPPSDDQDTVGPFGDNIRDFQHLNKVEIILQVGDRRIDDDIHAPVHTHIQSQDNLYDWICKLFPFSDWGEKVFASRKPSTNAQGQTVPRILDTVYDSRRMGQAEAKHNINELQKELFDNPSPEPCYITITTSKNNPPLHRSPRERDTSGGHSQQRSRHPSDKKACISVLLDTLRHYR